MRVAFLGTGPSRAIPRAGHEDALCQAAQAGGKSRRTRSAALVTGDDGSVALVDAGPDIALQLERARVGGIHAVLVTHAHDDAIAGLRRLDALLPARVPLHAHKQALARIAARFGAFRRLAPRPVASGARFAIGAAEARAFLVRHSQQPGFPTFGFAWERVLAYASDVAAIPPASARIVRGVGTVVLDAAMWIGRRMPAHLSVDQAIATAAALRAQRLVLTHLGHSFPPHELAEEEARAYLERLRVERPYDVRLAWDGMELTA